MLYLASLIFPRTKDLGHIFLMIPDGVFVCPDLAGQAAIIFTQGVIHAWTVRGIVEVGVVANDSILCLDCFRDFWLGSIGGDGSKDLTAENSKLRLA